jgi:hypothetical protein
MSSQMMKFITNAAIVLIAVAVIAYILIGLDSGSGSQVAYFTELFS